MGGFGRKSALFDDFKRFYKQIGDLLTGSKNTAI